MSDMPLQLRGAGMLAVALLAGTAAAGPGDGSGQGVFGMVERSFDEEYRGQSSD